MRKEEYNWTAEDNFVAHTRLIEQILLFETLVADEYGLTLDPEIATYYLLDTTISKLPQVLEHLGQIRAYSSVLLVKKQIDERQRALLNAQIIELDSKIGELRINLDKTGRYNPAMQAPASAASKSITNLAQRLTGLVAADILAGRFAMIPEDFLYTATVEIDKGYKQLDESLLTMAKDLIKARIAKAENEFRKSVSIAFMIFLALLYFSISMYYAIVGSIQLLARSARSFASGNLRERINLGTHDELSWIGDSFNEMAEGFSAMLEVHREDEARLRATIETALDAVVQMNSEGIITGWNDQAEKIFGWTARGSDRADDARNDHPAPVPRGAYAGPEAFPAYRRGACPEFTHRNCGDCIATGTSFPSNCPSPQSRWRASTNSALSSATSPSGKNPKI